MVDLLLLFHRAVVDCQRAVMVQWSGGGLGATFETTGRWDGGLRPLEVLRFGTTSLTYNSIRDN